MPKKSANKAIEGHHPKGLVPGHHPNIGEPDLSDIDTETMKPAAAAAPPKRTAAEEAWETPKTDETGDGPKEAAAAAKEAREALPEMHECTGGKELEPGVTIQVTPLRSGEFKDCFFSEGATGLDMMTCRNTLIRRIDAGIRGQPNCDLTLVSCSPENTIQAQWMRCDSQQSGKTCVLLLRVLEKAKNLVIDSIEDHCAVQLAYQGPEDDEYPYECVLSDTYPPGDVVCEAKLQRGVDINVSRAMDIDKKAYRYRFELDAEVQKEVEKDGYFVAFVA